MIDQPPPELFAQRPVQSTTVARPRAYRIRRFLTCLIAAALIGGGVYEIYLWKRAPGEIPTIRADGTLKQKPDQPGGIDIPNQDVTAYQQIDGSDTKLAGEHLLPPPETPQPVETQNIPPPPTPNASESLASQPPSQPILTTVSPRNAAPDSLPAAAAQTAAPANVEKAEVPAPTAPSATSKETPTKTANNLAPQAQPAKPAAGKKGGVRVQLASFPDENEAEHEMGRMQEKFAGQLGNAKLHLAKADLGARGIYYRVQSNPMNDGDAHDICTALKNLKAGCIIVKP